MPKLTKTVVTSELREGDIVLCHGLRCLIDRPLRVSESHADRPGVGDGKTRYVQALVLNRDDEATGAVPKGWTADWKRNSRDEPLPHDGEHRWTIQGNDLAYWTVEFERELPPIKAEDVDDKGDREDRRHAEGRCRHGVYVGGIGIDWMCGRCEDGEE